MKEITWTGTLVLDLLDEHIMGMYDKEGNYIDLVDTLHRNMDWPLQYERLHQIPNITLTVKQS